MLFDIKDLNIDIIKKFDGVNNYFNPSCFDDKIIFRKESIYQEKMIVNDIVDINNNIILKNNVDENYFWCYEDARFINKTEISVTCCKRNKDNPIEVINVHQKKYNLSSKSFTHYKTQNSYFEKNWQFFDRYILYHVNPYTIMDTNEDIIYKKEINWNYWIKKYGMPGLSSNIFTINNNKYILFHSYKQINGVNLKYYTGILMLNSTFKPISYTCNPIFPSVEDFDRNTFVNYFNWKRKLYNCPTIVDVIFPMNVIIDDVYVNIYSGINDCICANVKIDKKLFIDTLKETECILV